VLPLWREQVNVFLHPRHVVLLRTSRGPMRRVVRKQILTCASDAVGRFWDAPVSMLDKALQQDDWRKANLQIVLSNHFVNYSLISGAERLTGLREKEAYLRHRFVEIYGEAAKLWDLRLSGNEPELPALASGVEQGLLQSLQESLARHDLIATGIYPHLMVALNQMRRQMGHGTAWIVVLESGRTCFLLLEKGRLCMVRNHAADVVDIAQLAPMLERESLILGDETDDRPIWLYWPESTELPFLAGRNIKRTSQRLPDGVAGGDDPLYRLALWA